MVNRKKYNRNKKRKSARKGRIKNTNHHAGSLKRFGFNEKESVDREKNAVRRADKKYGKSETDRKLALLEAVTHGKVQDKIRGLINWNKK